MRWHYSALLLVLAAVGAQALRLPLIINDNMVLQAPTATVWGWSDPFVNIAINLQSSSGSSSYIATADPSGNWSTSISGQVGVPYTITFSDVATSVTISNVLFGDVVLCSGQSNMEMTVWGVNNASGEIADSANYPMLRLFSVAKVASWNPLLDVQSKTDRYNWSVSEPNAFEPDVWGVFSATCYFAGREVYKRLNPNGQNTHPVGLVASSWGGTLVEAWSSPDAMAQCKSERKEADVEAEMPLSLLDPPGPNNISVLWNGMIYPLLNMRFTYAVWYQGEANAGDPTSYACRFPAMIKDWRTKLDLPLPFFFVQLAAYAEGGANWPLLQGAQYAALQLPSTGFAAALDLGDPSSPWGDIHPRDKQSVGARLERAIGDVVYPSVIPPVVSQGPQVSSVRLQPDNSVIIELTTGPESQGLFWDSTESCSYCCDLNAFELQYGTSWMRATSSALLPGGWLNVTWNNQGPITGIRYAFDDYPQCVLRNTDKLPMTVWASTLSRDDEVAEA